MTIAERIDELVDELDSVAEKLAEADLSAGVLYNANRKGSEKAWDAIVKLRDAVSNAIALVRRD